MSYNLELNLAEILSGGANVESDVFPVISEDTPLSTPAIPDTLPILPIRNTVLFPGVLIPLSVERNKSIKLVRDIYKKNKIIGVVSQMDAAIDEPKSKDIYQVGTVAQIIKILELPDESTSVIIQGRQRFRVNEMVSENPYFLANISLLEDTLPDPPDKEFDALISSLKDISLKIIRLSVNIPPEASFAVRNIENPTFLVNFICSNSGINLVEKQKLLEIDDIRKRAVLLLEHLTREMQMAELKGDIQRKVKSELDQQQREFLLHQQMKTIQEELGGNPMDKEIEALKKKAKKKKWLKPVADTFQKEIEKIQRLHPASSEYSVQMNYLHTLLELPWNEYTKDNFNLPHAEKVLEEDHFGLEKVKDRILEHLAVLKLKGDLKSPILCLYGPPGVGKTSLGKSVARALGRKYARMSLGGLHDEAEIRGHRRTYIGALPGRIVQNLKKVKSSNPVFILDEIDKVGNDFRGDPSSALLEVLDPEQNSAFYDNYLELDYDLSKVMFIATANITNSINPALRDRMEMINISGYIVEEKIEIAKRHLLPKLLKNHGLKKGQLILEDKIIESVIDNFTRESGVRELEKKLAKVIRYIAKQVAFDKKYEKTLSPADISAILGPPEYIKEIYQGNDYAGVVTGLAWTAAGGEILYVETSVSKGKGTLTLTGNLGDVMKESATIALEYIKAHADSLNLPRDIFEKWNIHVHVPEGAIPKDGPSAGITMAASLASSFTQRKVKMGLAMTGEITLRGKVLPVGGIKEKILAARRAGITDIILSADNTKDVAQINAVYLKGLNFHYVTDISQVFDLALLDEKVPNPVNFG